MIKRILLLFSLALIVFSCAPKERLIYYQGIDNFKQSDEASDFEPQLKQDDLLMIIVSAPDPEAAVPFNLAPYGTTGTNSDKTTGTLTYQTYLIDKNGSIEFPVLGTLKLGGLKKTQAVEKIKSELKKYINSPIVNLRIMNYKFSITGEVARPGSFNIPTERITLMEALGMAGDLTIYGNRKHILVIRDIDGVKTHNYIDITSSDFINSPFYYLDQNDQVYVEPNKTKINSSAVGPNITVVISALSLLITVIAIITR